MSNDARISNNSSIFKTIIFRDAVDFNPAVATDLRNGDNYEYCQMDFSNRAQDEAFQSAKFDFGVDRAPLYELWFVAHYLTGTTDGDVAMSFRIAPATQSTPGYGNAGHGIIDGVADDIGDEVAEGTNGGIYGQMKRVGAATIQAVTTPQIAIIGTYAPLTRWATLVCENDIPEATDTVADETHAILVPVGYNN